MFSCLDQLFYGQNSWPESFFFKQKTAYEFSACLVGSEMCIRDSDTDGLDTDGLDTDGLDTDDLFERPRLNVLDGLNKDVLFEFLFVFNILDILY